MDKSKKKIEKKSYYISISLFVLLSLCVNGFYYAREYKNEIENSYELGDVFVSQGERSLKNYIEEAATFLSVVAENEVIIDVCLDPESEEKRDIATKYLTTLERTHDRYINLPIAIITDKEFSFELNGVVYDITNGTTFLDSGLQKSIGSKLSDYDYIGKIIETNDYYISKVYRSNRNGNPIFAMGYPIAYHGELIGIAITGVELETITRELIDHYEFQKTGEMTIIDFNNTIISNVNRDLIMKNYIEIKNKSVHNIDELTKRTIAGETRLEITKDDTTYLYSSKILSIPAENTEIQWYLAFTSDKDIVLEDVHLLGKYLIFINLIIIATAIFVMRLLYKKFNTENEKSNLEDVNKKLESKVKKRTHELTKMASIDVLTGLYNHKTSNEKLEESLNSVLTMEGKHVTIAMLDIDNFKDINDIFGYVVGDKVIKDTANILLSNVRNSDVVGRYGGEEFIIIFNDCILEDAVEKVEAIRSEIERTPVIVKDKLVNYTISCSVVTYKGEEAVELVEKADRLLYKAKITGKNKVVYKM